MKVESAQDSGTEVSHNQLKKMKSKSHNNESSQPRLINSILAHVVYMKKMHLRKLLGEPTHLAPDNFILTLRRTRISYLNLV